MSFKKGDRVQILQTGEEGEVIEEVYDPILIAFKPRIEIQLKHSRENKVFTQEELQLVKKRPTQEEVIKAVGKIQEQIPNIPNLRKREKEELPTHLKYLIEDIQASNAVDKQLGEANLNFVEKTLLALEKSNPKANYWHDVATNLDIVNWWTRTS